MDEPTTQADGQFEQEGWITLLSAEERAQLEKLAERKLRPAMSVTSYTQPKTMTLLLWNEENRVVATSNSYLYPSDEDVPSMVRQVYARADRFD